MPLTHAKSITRFSAAVSVAVGLLAPVSYGVVSYNKLTVTAAVTADAIGEHVTRFVSENPDSWKLLGDRLKFLLEEERVRHGAIGAGRLRITVADRQGTVIAASGAEPPRPHVTHRIPVFDFGTVAGTMSLDVTARPLVIQTALIAGLSAILAVLIFFPLRMLPQRALERAANDLANARNVLIRHEARRLEALGNLAGGMAHELNNMLLPILSLTDLVRRGLPEGGRDRGRLDKVVEAAERASSIVGSVLDFSRMRQTEAERLDLAAVVTDGLEVIRKTAPKTADIRTRITESPCFVNGNDQQIRTILVNLVSNAIEALAGKPGRITIGVNVIQLNGEAVALPHLVDGEYAEVSVTDTGIGMDEEIQKRLFDPFFTTKEVGKGVGMGLSMAHGIAEQHGGAITVNSAPGGGSTFRVLLPLVDA